MTLSWNVVTKNIHPHEQLQEKLREKISKLERHLQHFRPDAVHLQVVLSRQGRKGQFTAALTLRVPSHVLQSTKSADDPIPALDQAVKALLREVSSFKAGLRREASWKRTARRQQLRETKPFRFAAVPLAPGEGPETLADVVRGVVKEQYEQLLYYIRRQLWRAETEGAIPRHALDAEAVADEVARQAISRPQSKPADRTYRLWLYSLARRELERRFREYRDQARTSFSLDASPERPNLASRDEGYSEGEPISLFERPRDRSEEEAKDTIPDAHILPPDLAASDHDLIEHLQHAAGAWPQEERTIFELHFLEGFEPEEVAMLEKLRTPQVSRLIEQVQARLREVLTEAVQARVAQRPKSTERDWTSTPQRVK